MMAIMVNIGWHVRIDRAALRHVSTHPFLYKLYPLIDVTEFIPTTGTWQPVPTTLVSQYTNANVDLSTGHQDASIKLLVSAHGPSGFPFSTG